MAPGGANTEAAAPNIALPPEARPTAINGETATSQSIDALEKSTRVWPAANQQPTENVPPNPLRSITP
jgi:hypothetical protein